MKNVFFLLFTSLFLGACSSNPRTSSSEINVVELNYGICDMDIVSSIPLNNAPTGEHRISKNFKIFKKTDVIPCITDQSFGVSYVVNSNEKKNVSLQVKWTFPEAVTNEKGERFAQTDYTENVITNEVRHSTYTLGEKYLEVKGDWKFELFSHGEKLYEKKFRLN